MFDGIVIGSGIGGLTTAALLARFNGSRILVLERSLEPGGLTRPIRREGASWDVGVNHVGEMGPGTSMRGVSDVVTAGQLEWRQLPKDFQRLVYPGFQIEVSTDRDEYLHRLITAFPDEEPAIRRYFKDADRVARWARLSFAEFLVPERAKPFIRLLRRPRHRLAAMTVREYLDRNFQSLQLKEILANQWGDYGFPPASSAFRVHSLVVDHFFQGAWFPEGGSARVARTIEAVIEASGGAVRVGCEVARILLEDGRAVGVEVIDGRGPRPRVVEYRAPIIISAAGAATTYGQLLPRSGEVAAATAELRNRVGDTGPGHAAVVLLLRLRESPSSLGVTNQDIWVHADLDDADSETHTRRLFAGVPTRCQISFPGLKSGQSLSHTAHIIAFAPPEAFHRWERFDAGIGHEALKDRIGQGLLQLAETVVPGLTDLTEYSELSTPWASVDGAAKRRGAIHGPAVPSKEQRANLLGPITPIPGLFLSGEDAGCPGFGGALMGGVTAAAQIVGPRCWSEIQQLSRGRRPAPTPSTSLRGLPRDRYHARVLERFQLTDTAWLVSLEVDGAEPGFEPGQFVRVRVGEWDWRDHSIVAWAENRLDLLISTHGQGIGSTFFGNATPGTPTVVELPLGRFHLRDSQERRIFVAEDVGIAPFLPMFQSMGPALTSATLIHEARHPDDRLVTRLQRPVPAEVIESHGAAEVTSGRPHGALAEVRFDPASTEFYLSGGASFVARWRAALRSRGILDHVYHESF